MIHGRASDHDSWFEYDMIRYDMIWFDALINSYKFVNYSVMVMMILYEKLWWFNDSWFFLWFMSSAICLLLPGSLTVLFDFDLRLLPHVPSKGSAQQGMGCYPDGRGAAFSTSMKLYHLGRRAFLPSQAFAWVQDVRACYCLNLDSS